MNELIDERLVAEAIDANADRRRECAGVWDANERWARATVADARLAFPAYPGALGVTSASLACARRRFARTALRLLPAASPSRAKTSSDA
jgi:hypothetical protein